MLYSNDNCHSTTATPRWLCCSTETVTVIESLILSWQGCSFFSFSLGRCRHLEFQYAGEVVVTVVKGEKLKNKDLFGKSDPRAVIWLRPTHRAATRVAPNSLSPVWNETFVLPVDDPHTSQLYVEVHPRCSLCAVPLSLVLTPWLCLVAPELLFLPWCSCLVARVLLLFRCPWVPFKVYPWPFPCFSCPDGVQHCTG